VSWHALCSGLMYKTDWKTWYFACTSAQAYRHPP